MIRLSTRFIGAAALFALFIPALQAAAQQHVPPAPDTTSEPSAPTQQPAGATPADQPQLQAPPAAPAPSGPPVFPKPDPGQLHRVTPTKEVVDSFLQANWGYDTDRMWQVQAIRKTPSDGVSQVIVLYRRQDGQAKAAGTLLFCSSRWQAHHQRRGHHQLRRESLCRSAPAVAATRQRPVSRSSPSKDLELVEFADFQCPHCKEAQANMDKLVADYPKARIVFQNFPIASIHPAGCECGRVWRLRDTSWAAARHSSSLRPRFLTVRMAWRAPTAQPSRSTAPPPRPDSIRRRSRPAPLRLKSRRTSKPRSNWEGNWVSSKCPL